jgi:hypothetical protein
MCCKNDKGQDKVEGAERYPFGLATRQGPCPQGWPIPRSYSWWLTIDWKLRQRLWYRLIIPDKSFKMAGIMCAATQCISEVWYRGLGSQHCDWGSFSLLLESLVQTWNMMDYWSRNTNYSSYVFKSYSSMQKFPRISTILYICIFNLRLIISPTKGAGCRSSPHIVAQMAIQSLWAL